MHEIVNNPPSLIKCNVFGNVKLGILNLKAAIHLRQFQTLHHHYLQKIIYSFSLSCMSSSLLSLPLSSSSQRDRLETGSPESSYVSLSSWYITDLGVGCWSPKTRYLSLSINTKNCIRNCFVIKKLNVIYIRHVSYYTCEPNRNNTLGLSIICPTIFFKRNIVYYLLVEV